MKTSRRHDESVGRRQDIRSMILTTVILFILVAGLTHMVRDYLFPRHPSNLPPMPSRPLPLVGHLLAFASGIPADTFKRWREKAGSAFSVYIGSKLLIVFTDYSIIKDVFVKKHEGVASRADMYVMKVLSDPEQGMNGIVGDKWKDHRAVSLAIMKAFGMGSEKMAERVAGEVSLCINELHRNKGKPLNIHLLIHHAVSNVIFNVLVGQRYDYGNPYYVKIVKTLHEQLKLLNQSPAVDVFSWLMYLPTWIFPGKKLLANTTFFFNFFREYIEKNKEELDDYEQDNFIRAYLREKIKYEASGKTSILREQDLESLSYIFLLAGAESTSTSVLWNILYSINFPEKQKKIFEEIKEVVGTERRPTMQDRKQMHYFLAFSSEVQRIRNLIPILFPRRCEKTMVVQGYTIPEGAYATALLDGVLFDEKLWGDPYEFRPERFIDENGTFHLPEFYIPFFFGKRSCPGESLATMEIFLFLTSIFQRYEVLPEIPGQMPTLEPDYSAGRLVVPFRARFVERA